MSKTYGNCGLFTSINVYIIDMNISGILLTTNKYRNALIWFVIICDCELMH